MAPNRSPFRYAPASSAENSSPPTGSSTTPATTTPSTAAAIEIENIAKPCAKLLVPSMGSTIHSSEPLPRAPDSSPVIQESGTAPVSAAARASSVAPSWMVTRSWVLVLMP